MGKFKVAFDAGHGGFGVTPGKRTPDGEYEWNFNNKVISSAIRYLEQYDDCIDILRLDDPSGHTDVPLSLRSYKADAWNADILISDHHNANTGEWGNWTGTETYTYEGKWEDAERLAEIIHSRILEVYQLRDRGLKKANFHMLREPDMPAILIEGGYMDSVIDIEKLRDDQVLEDVGIAIGKGVLEYAGIKERHFSIASKEGGITMDEFQKMLNDLRKLPVPSWEGAKDNWEEAKENGYFDGTGPQGLLTRVEAAIVVNRLRHNFKEYIDEQIQKALEEHINEKH